METSEILHLAATVASKVWPVKLNAWYSYEDLNQDARLYVLEAMREYDESDEDHNAKVVHTATTNLIDRLRQIYGSDNKGNIDKDLMQLVIAEGGYPSTDFESTRSSIGRLVKDGSYDTIDFLFDFHKITKQIVKNKKHRKIIHKYLLEEYTLKELMEEFDYRDISGVQKVTKKYLPPVKRFLRGYRFNKGGHPLAPERIAWTIARRK
jgi:hypothetical protein